VNELERNIQNSEDVHTLLLADASVTIQRMMALIFADQDVRVVAVGDGDQAIARLDTAPPDIVLADSGMPGRNGYEVARHVRQSPRLAHIPVLLLTGAFEPVDQVRATEAGCAGILAKPFEPQLVVSRVRQLLAGPPSGPAALDEHATRGVEAPAPSMARSLQPTAPDVDIAAKADELDDYFDRLGKAFAERLAAAAETPPPPDTSDRGTDGPAAVTDTGESFDSPSPARPVSAVADGDFPVRSSAAFEPAPGPETPAAAQTTDSSTSSALAEKFAALLGGERSRLQGDATPTGGGPPLDDIVEQVTRRVLAQLTDRVVRETIADLVSDTAERLIREEIQRIKALLK
jgi:CheY-like chemotaxis protein